MSLSRTPPARMTRTEFAGQLLTRLEAKGFPRPLLNRYAAELYTGHAALNRRKEENIIGLLQLSPEELSEWRRLMHGGD